MPHVHSLRRDDIKIPAARVLVLDKSVDVSHLRPRDKSNRNRRMNAPPFFQYADFSVKNVEAAAPERTEARSAAVLMEIARVAKLKSIVRAFRNRHLMEIAKHRTGIHEVIRDRGQIKPILFS